jgi:glycosyltransferase involved in cell wall biosynthesis
MFANDSSEPKAGEPEGSTILPNTSSRPRRTKLRILHCLRAPVGGLFRHVRDLAARQARQGHAVGVLCDATAQDRLTEVRLDALSEHLELGLHKTPMARNIGLSDLSATRTTHNLARAMQIDILHGHGAKGGAYARLAARRMRANGLAPRAIYTPHGGSLHYSPASLPGFIFMALERRLLRQTDAIVFESAFARSRFIERVGKPSCLTPVIHNGLEDSEFAPIAPRPDATDFVFVGELRELKGVRTLLQALERINRTRETSATIVGDGPDREAFESLSGELGLETRVTFTGAMPAPEAFELGRCLVMPSHAESLPYVVLEAAAAAVPLIATEVGGIPEIVAGTDTPLIPPGDAETLADAMAAALAEPKSLNDRATRLRTSLAERFSAGGMAEAIEDAYFRSIELAVGQSSGSNA